MSRMGSVAVSRGRRGVACPTCGAQQPGWAESRDRGSDPSPPHAAHALQPATRRDGSSTSLSRVPPTETTDLRRRGRRRRAPGHSRRTTPGGRGAPEPAWARVLLPHSPSASRSPRTLRAGRAATGPAARGEARRPHPIQGADEGSGAALRPQVPARPPQLRKHWVSSAPSRAAVLHGRAPQTPRAANPGQRRWQERRRGERVWLAPVIHAAAGSVGCGLLLLHVADA